MTRPQFRRPYFFAAALMFLFGTTALYVHNADWRTTSSLGFDTTGIIANGFAVFIWPGSEAGFDVGRTPEGLYFTTPSIEVLVDWWTAAWLGFVGLPLLAGALTGWWRFDSLAAWRWIIVYASCVFAAIVLIFAVLLAFVGLVYLSKWLNEIFDPRAKHEREEEQELLEEQWRDEETKRKAWEEEFFQPKR